MACPSRNYLTYPRMDLRLDDVDSVAGDGSWEEALLALYESVLSSGGSLVIAGRYPPGQGRFQLPDLATRLASGGVWAVFLSEEDVPGDAASCPGELRFPDAVTAYLECAVCLGYRDVVFPAG